MSSSLRAATSLLVLVLAHAAHADPAIAPAPDTDAAADNIANANLEPTGRHGMVFSGSLLPGEFIGLGSRSDTGLSGSVSFRLGKVASPTTTMYAEVSTGALVHQPASTPDMPKSSATNSLGALLVGAQHYVAPSLWLRIGFGFGSYVRNQEPVDGVLVAHEVLPGPVGEVGIGIDLVRWRYVTLGLEASSTLLIHHGGTTAMSGLGLGLTF